MVERKDWVVALLLNIVFWVGITFIPMNYKAQKERKRDVVIQLRREMPSSREESGISDEAIDEDFSTMDPVFPIDMPDLAPSPSYKPQTEEVHSLTPGEDLSLVDVSYSLPMPDDPFMDDWEEVYDSAISENSENIDSENNSNWDFIWQDGYNRKIQYIPPWDRMIEAEMDKGIDSLTITFMVNTQGYVEEVYVPENLSVNGAWKDLLINWISRMVFEPGEEVEGSILLQFIG